MNHLPELCVIKCFHWGEKMDKPGGLKAITNPPRSTLRYGFESSLGDIFFISWFTLPTDLKNLDLLKIG